jgi:hypothetical protein
LPAQHGGTLLLSIDPVASLAEAQEQLRASLQEIAPPVPNDLRLAWEEAARAAIVTPPAEARSRAARLSEHFVVLVTCRDQEHQAELLRRFTVLSARRWSPDHDGS